MYCRVKYDPAASATGRTTSRGRLKCDGTRAETIFHLSAKRTSPFKSAPRGCHFQSTTGSWGVRVSCSNAGYTSFRGSVKSTGYPLHSPVSPSLPLPCVTVRHHISTGLYLCEHFALNLFACNTTWWSLHSLGHTYVYYHLNIKKHILLSTQWTSIYVFLIVPRIRSISLSKENR